MAVYFFPIVVLVLLVVVVIRGDDGNEPPLNPFLANSPWSMTHRNSYCQGSSPLPALGIDDDVSSKFRFQGRQTPFNQPYTNPDDNGNQALWQNTRSSIGKVMVSMNNTRSRRIDLEPLTVPDNGLSLAYQLLDKDGIFYAFRDATIYACTDEVVGDILSDVVVKLSLDFKDVEGLLQSDDDGPVGINMSYDGYLVFATAKGNVGIMTREFTDLQFISLGVDEEVSNSFALDEDGGIYVVTNKHMHRVQWDGSVLSIAWTADYGTGSEDLVVGRLGTGSGSTPSLMGTRAAGQDRFVVITDAQELMHLVLFWRDEIPDDWTPIAPGKDLRIAAEVPITFGEANVNVSISEQSVLVRGYGAMVVNNDYRVKNDIPQIIANTLSGGFLPILFSNVPALAPFGVEKLEWDPITRTLNTVWTNHDVSCPNGIPTMSATSNLAYCLGQRNRVWTLEAMDWDTGESVFFKETGVGLRFNSMYAGMIIGPNKEIVTGTIFGMLQFEADDVGGKS